MRKILAFAARNHLLYLVLLGALICIFGWRSPPPPKSSRPASPASPTFSEDEIAAEARRIEEAMRGHERVMLEAHLYGRDGKSLTSPIPDRIWWTEDALANAAGADVARAAMTTAIGTDSQPVAAAWGTWIVKPLARRPRFEPSELRGEAILSLRRTNK
jgi:hypothetical protein